MISTDTRALVTGGAGFIGSHLVERLVDLGARVAVIDDLSTGRVESLRAVAARIDFEHRPLGEALHEPDFILDFDVIFHLAANPYIPPSVEDPSYDYELNLDTTFRLLEALRRGERPPRLVNTSSAAVYGNPQRLPIRESDPTVPISPYGVSKLAAERYVAVYSQLYGISASSVRLFSVYGPRQRKQVVYDLFDRLACDPGRLEVIGDGTQERDFAYVEDVAAAMILVAQRAPAAGEVFNVASGSTHSIAELVSGICDALELRPEVDYTGTVRPGDADRWSVDTSALRALGYEPSTTLVQGLRMTRDWYRAERRS
jgi:UDP-glucose 4-epimerase